MTKKLENKIKNCLTAGFRICLVCLLSFALPIRTNAQKINCAQQRIDDRNIRESLPAEVAEKRRQIIQAIWGNDHIPNRSDVLISVGVSSPLHAYPVVARVDKIEIPSLIPVKPGSPAINDLAYLFVPVIRNGRLVIDHHGHACTFKDAQLGDNGYGMEASIIGLLTAGYDVLAVYMPQVTETKCNLDHCGLINTDIGLPNPRKTFGLRLFLEPTIVSLNYLLKKNSYKSVDMMGLSGGGWTTTLIAAIDDRIRFSFPVAGSLPLYYRFDRYAGDIEQFLPEFYRDIAGYPDLYILGAYGNGRKQIQILNLHDNCCFGQPQHDPNRNYISDIHTYEQTVKERLVNLGAANHYQLVIDTVAQSHQISKYALNEIILPQLSSGIREH